MGQGVGGWNATGAGSSGPRPTSDMANATGRVELGLAMVAVILGVGVLQV